MEKNKRKMKDKSDELIESWSVQPIIVEAQLNTFVPEGKEMMMVMAVK